MDSRETYDQDIILNDISMFSLSLIYFLGIYSRVRDGENKMKQIKLASCQRMEVPLLFFIFKEMY